MGEIGNGERGGGGGGGGGGGVIKRLLYSVMGYGQAIYNCGMRVNI